MNQLDSVYELIRESACSIDNPRFYQTERGFQGELLSEINRRWQINEAIVEQEYQKKIRHHGIKIRPDIIIHVPYNDAGFGSRKEGNFVVIELKLMGIKRDSLADYDNLSEMCRILDYPLGVFINIGSEETFLNDFNGPYKDRIRAFGITLENAQPVLHEP